jgi:hypothetical protein
VEREETKKGLYKYRSSEKKTFVFIDLPNEKLLSVLG